MDPQFETQASAPEPYHHLTATPVSAPAGGATYTGQGGNPSGAAEAFANYAEENICAEGGSLSMTESAERMDRVLVDRSAPRPIVMDKDSELYRTAGERGQDAFLDEFLLDYNFFCGTAGLFTQSVGRVEVFAAASGLDPDVPALAGGEFAELGKKLADPKNQALKNLVDGALVTEDADETVTNSLAELGSARDGLKGAIAKLRAMQLRLERRKLEAKKQDLGDQVTEIGARIAKIKEIIAGVEQIAALAATACVSAGGTVVSDTGKAALDGGVVSTVAGWFVDATYAPKIEALKKQITALDNKIEGIDLGIDASEVEGAAHAVGAAKKALDALKVNLRNRLTAQRGRYENVGENLDGKKKGKDKPRNEEAISCTTEGRYEQLIRLVGAIRERLTFGRAVLDMTTSGALADAGRVVARCTSGVQFMPRMDPETMQPDGVVWGDNSLDETLFAARRVTKLRTQLEDRLPFWETTEATWTSLLANARGGGDLKDY